MEKEPQKPYFANYNLLLAKDLRKSHNQILLIILLKEFIKLIKDMNMIIKDAKCVELITKIVSSVSKTQMLKTI